MPTPHILITGATDGIGLAMARLYAERGARLILVGRRPLAALDDALFSEATYCRADLSQLDCHERGAGLAGRPQRAAARRADPQRGPGLRRLAGGADGGGDRRTAPRQHLYAPVLLTPRAAAPRRTGERQNCLCQLRRVDPARAQLCRIRRHQGSARRLCAQPANRAARHEQSGHRSRAPPRRDAHGHVQKKRRAPPRQKPLPLGGKDGPTSSSMPSTAAGARPPSAAQTSCCTRRAATCPRSLTLPRGGRRRRPTASLPAKAKAIRATLSLPARRTASARRWRANLRRGET